MYVPIWQDPHHSLYRRSYLLTALMWTISFLTLMRTWRWRKTLSMRWSRSSSLLLSWNYIRQRLGLHKEVRTKFKLYLWSSLATFLGAYTFIASIASSSISWGSRKYRCASGWGDCCCFFQAEEMRLGIACLQTTAVIIESPSCTSSTLSDMHAHCVLHTGQTWSMCRDPCFIPNCCFFGGKKNRSAMVITLDLILRW